MTTTMKQPITVTKLCNSKGIISALAIDQRGALKRMLSQYKKEVSDAAIEQFKTIVSEELTPYASAILLDPEYGLPAAKQRAQQTGLLMAYEKTGMMQRRRETPRLVKLLVSQEAQRGRSGCL